MHCYIQKNADCYLNGSRELEPHFPQMLETPGLVSLFGHLFPLHPTAPHFLHLYRVVLHFAQFIIFTSFFVISIFMSSYYLYLYNTTSEE